LKTSIKALQEGTIASVRLADAMKQLNQLSQEAILEEKIAQKKLSNQFLINGINPYTDDQA
jgi:hypothetical protein